MLIVLLLSVLAIDSQRASAPPAREIPKVYILTATGQPRAAMPPRPLPAKPDVELSASLSFFGPQGIKTSDGKTLGALGFNVWTDGSQVRVRVSKMYPTNGFPLSTGMEARDFTSEVLADFKLDLEQTRVLTEMTALGLDPMSIRYSAKEPGRPAS